MVAALSPVGAGQARPAKLSDAVTITMLAYSNQKPGFGVLIPNFERVYPNIKVNVSYAASTTTLYQLEATELAAGDGPDLLTSAPGCGQPVSVCVLAKAGDLAPMLKERWVHRSLPLVTSLSKNGKGLFTFEPQVSPYGVFTNDDLFRKLGLKVPQTFSQLLDLCQRAKAAGTVATIQAGDGGSLARLIESLAVATVYAKDKRWTRDLKAGTATFEGTPGWHKALQEFVDMNSAGCFEPGAAGTSAASAVVQFALGRALMFANTSSQKGAIDAAGPQFTYSQHPFPGGTAGNQTSSFLNLNFSVSVNAHASAQNQAAARTFVDFLARPKQNALYAQLVGGLTQYEFLKGHVPLFMSAFTPMFREHHYVINPEETWWNANVLLALETYAVGLITGQSSIDGVLNAMDAAWKQGPA